MSNAKKSTSKKAVVVKVLRTRKPNALHEKLVKLFTRPTGATVQDVAETKFYGPAIAALRIVERRGYKTNVIKKSGRVIALRRKEGLTMSLAQTEREALVSKLRSAEAELYMVIIEEEEVDDLASDLRAVIDRLQQIILRIQSPL